MNNKNKINIVYLGCSGFPYGLAEIQKLTLVSKSLVATGNAVTVICNRGMHKKTNYPALKASGNFQGIEFIYTSGTPFRHDNFLKRNLLKIKGFVNEFLLLKHRRKKNELDYVIISSNNFYTIFYYLFLSKIFHFKTIFNYVEYYSGVKRNWYKLFKRIGDRMIDIYVPKIADAVFPISEFLVRQVQKVAPGKKYLKIPVLADFERYDVCEIEKEHEYFLFCGSAGYWEVIKFIIDSFNQLNDTPVFLYLIINGSDAEILGIRDYINRSSLKERVKIFSQLTEKKLDNYYKNATALLIPLRPTLQDEARFPHKIGEYLASGNPVISTNYGEVKHYFRDAQNMLIADSYSISLFAGKMKFVLENKTEAQKIGDNGKKMASNLFDYRLYGERVVNFLDELYSNGRVGVSVTEQPNYSIKKIWD